MPAPEPATTRDPRQCILRRGGMPLAQRSLARVHPRQRPALSTALATFSSRIPVRHPQLVRIQLWPTIPQRGLIDFDATLDTSSQGTPVAGHCNTWQKLRPFAFAAPQRGGTPCADLVSLVSYDRCLLSLCLPGLVQSNGFGVASRS